MKRAHWRVSRRRKVDRQERTARGEKSLKPSDLVSALIAAQEQYGEDGQGKNGLVGFFKKVARYDPSLLLRLVTPAMVNTKLEPNQQPNQQPSREYRTEDEILEDLERRGLAPSLWKWRREKDDRDKE